MPKVVDHDARRAELAAAVWRVICSRGPTAVTIRDVAAEAGWSSGALRHYFPTREELLMFAFRLAGERAAERIRAAGDAPLADLLEQAMPLDQERRQEALIWFAFVGLAPADPALAAELERWYARVLDWLASRLTGRNRRRSRLRPVRGSRRDRRAGARHAGRDDPARQRAALRLQLDAIVAS